MGAERKPTPNHRLAAENGDPKQPNKSAVTHWVRYGVTPSGHTGTYLAEALSRRLKRLVALAEIGLPEPSRDLLDWRTDTLDALADLRRIDLDADRRRAVGAATGQRQAAREALLKAEDDLAAAAPGDEEPSRVFFFQEASLAHEMASALRDIGELDAAVREFERSVRTRKATTFTRTHAVTLGYLGQVHARRNNILGDYFARPAPGTHRVLASVSGLPAPRPAA